MSISLCVRVTSGIVLSLMVSRHVAQASETVNRVVCVEKNNRVVIEIELSRSVQPLKSARPQASRERLLGSMKIVFDKQMAEAVSAPVEVLKRNLEFVESFDKSAYELVAHWGSARPGHERSAIRLVPILDEEGGFPGIWHAEFFEATLALRGLRYKTDPVTGDPGLLCFSAPLI